VAELFSRFRRDRAAAAEPTSDLAAWFAMGLDAETMWNRLRPGPSAADVASRLGSAPGDFLDPRLDLVALAGDVLTASERVAGSNEEPILTMLATAAAQPASRIGAALALWLFASEELVEPFDPPLDRTHLRTGIAALALRLAPVVPPATWLVDADHRDEAARLFLLWDGLLPAGEDLATARARWDRRDSLTRSAALRQMMEDQQHRLDVQRALNEKRAAEAAARYSHE
jgi:hypothetical protein